MAEFERAWPRYPRRQNKAGALRAFVARRREGVSLADLERATVNYAESVAGTEPRFVLQGSTFFGSDRRFADFLDVAAVEPSAPTGWRELERTW